jgi:CheY-like chemotaxis protein
VVVRVKDEGVGIPPDLLPHIFDLFVQGDMSLERSQGGLGIGLTVVQKLVEMHGGTVTAFSEGPGQGSELVVRLPGLHKAPRKQPVAAGWQPTSRHVLVVDDNVDAAEAAGMLLRLFGHEVRLAHNGPEALQTAAESCPEVVLLDIGLPRMNGYDVARNLRQLPKFEKALLIAVTRACPAGRRRRVGRSRPAASGRSCRRRCGRSWPCRRGWLSCTGHARA